jgi:YebC/PmpR family DNA-binding regulatory protein
MVQKARDNSLPVDTIQRAIKRGTGEEEGVVYEQVAYEGYAPSGVAVIVQALTDNRNRTSAEIKNIFSRNGGSFAEPGAVSWQFERKGIVVVDRSADEDELTLAAADAGADDVLDLGESWQVTTPPTELHAVRTALEGADMPVKSSDLTMIPTTTVALDAEATAKAVLRLMDALEDQDDVEAVYANFDIPDSVLEAVSA